MTVVWGGEEWGLLLVVPASRGYWLTVTPLHSTLPSSVLSSPTGTARVAPTTPRPGVTARERGALHLPVSLCCAGLDGGCRPDWRGYFLSVGEPGLVQLVSQWLPATTWLISQASSQCGAWPGLQLGLPPCRNCRHHQQPPRWETGLGGRTIRTSPGSTTGSVATIKTAASVLPASFWLLKIGINYCQPLLPGALGGCNNISQIFLLPWQDPS